ncbi:MAG: carbohydrate ABC transporter permease [Clostridiaceae bacterium]|nr:carbohydrate ABC transporter permease [Clostridiaceae bacterium]
MRKKLNRSIGGNVFSLCLLILLGTFMALPLIYVVSNAFKPLEELFVYPPRFFVVNPTTQNFKDMVQILAQSRVTFTRYLFNTMFITIVGTFGHLFIASMAAFVVSRHKFPGKQFIFKLIVLSLMFTPSVTSVSSFIIMSRIKLLDTYWAILLPAFQSTLGLYLMKQFMDTLPEAVFESARIDGANEFKIYWKIAMPMVKPAWITLIILMVQNLWNTQSQYIFSEQMKSLPQAMQQILAGGISRTGVASAVSFLMMLVPLCVFVFSQSQVIETMTTSGIKE